MDVAVVFHPKGPLELLHRLALAQWDRAKRTLAAEADIGQPLFTVDVHGEQHVRSRPDLRGAHTNTGREASHLEAQRLVDGGEEEVVLKAVAVAPAGNQLSLKAVQVK
jgi:hypothetical protein